MAALISSLFGSKKSSDSTAVPTGSPEFRAFFPITEDSEVKDELTTPELKSMDSSLEKRSDIYIVIEGKPDYGLKLRYERNLELKLRTGVDPSDSRVEYYRKTKHDSVRIDAEWFANLTECTDRIAKSKKDTSHWKDIHSALITRDCALVKVSKARDKCMDSDIRASVEYARCTLEMIGFYSASSSDSSTDDSDRRMRELSERLNGQVYQSVCVEGSRFGSSEVTKKLDSLASSLPSNHIIGGYPIWMEKVVFHS